MTKMASSHSENLKKALKEESEAKFKVLQELTSNVEKLQLKSEG